MRLVARPTDYTQTPSNDHFVLLSTRISFFYCKRISLASFAHPKIDHDEKFEFDLTKQNFLKPFLRHTHTEFKRESSTYVP